MMASAPSIHAQKRKAFGRGAGWSGVALGMLARLALTEQIIDAASANGRMLRVYAHVFAMMPAAFALGLRCRTDLYAQFAIRCVQRGARYDQHKAQIVAQAGQQRMVAAAGMNIQLGRQRRSEEHTSELQSLMRISYAVFCLKK